MSHILLYRACNVFLKTPCLGYQKIPIRIGIFHACILAGSPEKATKMAEKKQAAQKCYGARGCLLKFRARSGLTEWSVTMHICQAARAQRPSASRPEISVRNLPENPHSNGDSPFEWGKSNISTRGERFSEN